MSDERAAYGKQIANEVAADLEIKFDRSIFAENLRQMIQFSEVFPDLEMVPPQLHN